MASSIKLTMFVALACLAFASVHSQMVSKSKITQYLEPLCTEFKSEVIDEGRCNHEVIDEIIDHADNIEQTATIREYEEEILELYLEQVKMKKMCYPDGTVIQSQCEAMESVCNFGGNIVRCRDVTPAPPIGPAQTTGAPTNPPTIPANAPLSPNF